MGRLSSGHARPPPFFRAIARKNNETNARVFILGQARRCGKRAAMPSHRESDKALRRDVRWLGGLLGKVLCELEGQKLFELEERIRKLAILRRRGPRETPGQAARPPEE